MCVSCAVGMREILRPRLAQHIGHTPDIDPRTLRAPIARAYDRHGMQQSALAGPAALLEREREVERVAAALHAALQGAGNALIVEGAAGMGKSRLLEAVRV